ncbi:MAG: DCC1-like thiol-disulfide oxidoreductase family protein [bacterium]|nr:DCC1-like thiol-disulfide oxidoreductase family protein [bacterium]MDE0667705.1 DCC1-like thiol-disulfide oxidoreductase family protein [bacterium]
MSHTEVGPAAPDLPALVYDGDCAFCGRCADWIRARLTADVAVVPAERADLAALGLTAQQAAEAAWWIDVGGRRRGHRAIAAALGACEGVWARLGRVLAWPGISLLAAGVYALVARNRRRLGCRNCLKRTRRGGPALSPEPEPAEADPQGLKRTRRGGPALAEPRSGASGLRPRRAARRPGPG